VFDRTKAEFRQQPPVNTAVKSYYYSVKDEDGTIRTEIEGFLSQVENSGKPVLDKLIAGKDINHSEKQAISVFVSFMMNRVPDYEKSVNEIKKHMVKKMSDMVFYDEERTQAIMDRVENETGEKSDISAQDLVDFYKSGEYGIEINRNFSLDLMLRNSPEFAKYFCMMDWNVFHAPARCTFVTTDNPVFLIPPEDHKSHYYGVGLITPGALKVFPLSQKTCLVMYDHGSLTIHAEATQQQVRDLNLEITNNAHRFVIGRDQALVRSLVNRTKLTEREPQMRFSIK
jgi:uncharacterized protein DUF4238